MSANDQAVNMWQGIVDRLDEMDTSVDQVKASIDTMNANQNTTGTGTLVVLNDNVVVIDTKLDTIIGLLGDILDALNPV